MAFLFAIIWGICSTITGSQARKQFDSHFRNLVDGLVKGHAKPASFKLARVNLFPDTGSVFDYTLDSTKAGGGQWYLWGEGQMSAEQLAESHQQQQQQEEESGGGGGGGGLTIPTPETIKQSYFLQLALNNGFPFGKPATEPRIVCT